MKNSVVSRAAFAFATLSVGASAQAMIVLAGGYVIPSGTTSAARPELAGGVLYDRWVSVVGTTPIYGRRISADLQTRVSRGNVDGLLTFSYRWIPRWDNQVSLTQLAVAGFGPFKTDVDYRTDGLGSYGTILVRRDADAQRVRFYMPNQPSYVGSYFHFVRTNARTYAVSTAASDRIVLSLYASGVSDPVTVTLFGAAPRPWGF